MFLKQALVVYVVREDEKGEYIHIISARFATKREKARYYQED
jgi:uncharacterized DUF497 family protein